MPLIEFTSSVIAGGSRRRPGERLEVDDTEARLLVGMKRATIVVDPLPVVIDSPPPAKSSSKRQARKPKSGEDPSPADNPSKPPAVEAPSSDAPPAAE